jgi:uncharacterized protein (DUF58 family)
VTPVAPPKLYRWVVLVATCLVAGLTTGRAELIVVAFPFAVALAAGVAAAEPIDVDIRWSVERDRLLEGEELVGTVTVESATPGAVVEIGIAVPPEFTPVEGSPRVALRFLPGESDEAVVRLRARRWGRYEVGLVAVRAAALGGLLAFEDVRDERVPVRVYPALEPLRSAVPPARTQVFAGNNVSRAALEGIEFAGVRGYARGDSVRRVNWRVTTRRRELHVNVAHPERNTDVVLWLDSFGDYGPAGHSSLDLTVRGALALARHYLAHRDRVGVVSFGGALQWITAGSGTPHELRVVDNLLGINPTPSWAWKDIDFLPRRTLPPQALVVAFTPLVDRRGIEALIDLRARGFPLVVVETLAEERVEADPSPEGRLAHRAWRLERAARRFDLGSLGIPVIRWSGDEPLEAALASVGGVGIGGGLRDLSQRGALLVSGAASTR